MPFPNSLTDRELAKFVANSDGDTAVRTVTELSSGISIGAVNIKAPTGPFIVTVQTIGLTAVDPIATPLVGRVSISLRNKSPTATLYFKEDNTVTADDAATGGWEIGPGEDFNIDLDDSQGFFLISNEAGCKVKIIQIAST